MEICTICNSGLLVVKMSAMGKEAYCSSCRQIVESATFGFKFANDGDDGTEPCKDANGVSGVKGPGKKARCWTWEPGNEKDEAEAREHARASVQAHRRSKGAARVAAKLATGYFTGGPATMSPPSTANNPMAPGAQPNPMPPIMQPGKSPMGVGGTGMNGEVPAAPGGIQPGNLNGPNPLNSGTTASVTPRLVELINDLENLN